MKNKKYNFVWKLLMGILVITIGGFLGYKYIPAGVTPALVKSWSDTLSGGIAAASPAADSGLSDEVDLNDGDNTGDTDAGDKTVAAVLVGNTGGDGVLQGPAGVSSNNDRVTPQAPIPADVSILSQTSIPVSTAPKISSQTCSMSDITSSSRKIILNEIAWMGSLPQNGETSAKASEREWIELKNISSGTIDLSGWQILDSSGNLKIILGAQGDTNTASNTSDTQVLSGGLYLLVRGDAALPGAVTDAGYAGDLSNAGEKIAVFDQDCGTSDFLDASAGWLGGDNATKQTLERDADGNGWHTSAMPGGTPLKENSMPLTIAPIASSTPSSGQQYIISVSSFGGGSGTVSSSPAGIVCGFACEANFSAGTKITVSAIPESGSLFKGWSRACSSTSTFCSFVVSSSVSVVAEFDPIAPEPSSSITSSVAIVQAPVQNQPASSTNLLIAAIQIAGASSSNDFVKIYNPTDLPVDISGWKLHKKSSAGTDVSLKTFSTGSTIASDGYFIWANSEGGFADSMGANASTTETLSADNSVALFDANGNIVDQVAWGTGVDQYVEGIAFASDPTAGQILARQTTNGAMIDTNNNASDFAIQ